MLVWTLCINHSSVCISHQGNTLLPAGASAVAHRLTKLPGKRGKVCCEAVNIFVLIALETKSVQR